MPNRKPEPLTEYRERRAFDRTPEPPGATDEVDQSSHGDRFVVQEHHARRLHWDLRLERDGVLVSWALPRGFPDTPDKNRLAVHTEDHPLEYLSFHGDIPAGEYGGGAMTIWDSGTYEAEKFGGDKVVVRLHGDRVQGKYALFRTRNENWMIHRMDPPDAGDPMPDSIVPMQATLSWLPRDDDNWGFEVKWDGVRAIGYGEPGRLRLVSRNLRDITSQYPEIGVLAEQLGTRRVVLDGELVALDDNGLPSFQRLQHRIHVTSASELRRRRREVPVTYVIFDLLYVDGRSLLDLTYEERRRELEALDLHGPSWQTPSYHRGDGAALLKASENQALEGIVAKRLDSTYLPGRRSRDWLKVKNVLRQEVVIGGWVAGQGNRSGRLGALLVGYYEPDSGEPRFRYAGKVGTGFDAADAQLLWKQLESLRIDESPFDGRQPQQDAVFVEPSLICEVEFSEWTKSGTMRHPSYEGLRDDKPVTEVVKETPVDPPKPESPTKQGETEVAHESGREPKLTNVDKVMYPETGTTKGDVIAYYREISDVLLPHLRGRPLTMKRYPDGVTGPHFYEKQCPSWRPDWVRTASIWSESKQRDVDFCVIDDLPTLLWAANLADLELHTLLARTDDLERPTMVVFDLDPGPDVGLRESARVALWVRDLLADLDLTSVVKASGSKGLHLHVPLNTPVGYDDTKPFAHAVAALIERQHRDAVTSRMTKELRQGKVLVDWSQNTPHKTTVTPFSLRAREHPTVATPLEWAEVEAVAAGRAEPRSLHFEAGDALRQQAERAQLFVPLLELTQELPRFDG